MASRGRATLPRRVTRGPLDDEDMLGSTPSSVSSPSGQSMASSHADTAVSAHLKPPLSTELPESAPQPDGTMSKGYRDKSLSFLLDPAIYHPLSQLDVAAPFRHPFPPLPSRDTPLASSLTQIDSLLSKCDFLSVAYLASAVLTSGAVDPTDSSSIFELISLRYSCLELTGNVLLAARESKALLDFESSEFYYAQTSAEEVADQDTHPRRLPLYDHIMPFHLRLQALRLQSIGFSDPRRGISALYELGSECQGRMRSTSISARDRDIWANRLAEISLRVVNALIDIGDLDCALRTLDAMEPSEADDTDLWIFRSTLLHIRLGNLSNAKKLIKNGRGISIVNNTLPQLLAIAEGRYENATVLWEQVQADGPSALSSLISQNLACSYLYAGKLSEAREIMETLVDSGCCFTSLTVNLATLYDLVSDKASTYKMGMASTVARHSITQHHLSSRSNADFKL